MRKSKWLSTGLPVKGNKKKAEALLLDARKNFELNPNEEAEKEQVKQSIEENTDVDLRHSCATLLLSNGGVSMKEVQEWLGHSDYSTTANIYSHFWSTVPKYLQPIQ